MPSSPEVVRHPDAEALVADVAERLVGRIAEVQRAGRVPWIVLTGGTIADALHERVAVLDAGGVSWELVDVWFGDERFVAADSPDRNALQAATSMLDKLPVDPARVHPMPAADGAYGDDVDAAASGYAGELAVAAAPDALPTFDVVMLGVGPDGHCASLFPGRREGLEATPVIPVRDSPKPPPTRISLTQAALANAREVWFVVSGAGKADAVSAALSGADPVDVPSAGPHGLEGTVWFVDEAAAAQL
jgi:6-phosphogluconolactonase